MESETDVFNFNERTLKIGSYFGINFANILAFPQVWCTSYVNRIENLFCGYNHKVRLDLS